MFTIVLNKMFSDKKKIFETSFLFRGLSFYGVGCIKKTTNESASPVNIKKTTLSQCPEHYIYSIEEIPLSQCFVLRH